MRSQKKAIFWVDEEETVAFPDILDLRYAGYEVELTVSASEALDWIIERKAKLEEYSAFVVDIQLPFQEDTRFSSETATDGAFSGLKVCELAISTLPTPAATYFKSHTILYTRLPDTPRMSTIKDFASRNSICFVDKSGDVSLLKRLRELRLIEEE